MKKNMILGITVLVIIIAIIIVVGFTNFYSVTNNTTTYNDGAVMFNYPSNMTTPSENISSNNTSSVWNYTSLTDNTTNILLGKTAAIPNPLISSSVMSQYLQTGYGQLISNDTLSTNPNGVQVYRYAYEANYTNITYYYLDFANKNNSTIYEISVYGNDTTQSQNIADQIFNSLKQS